MNKDKQQTDVQADNNVASVTQQLGVQLKNAREKAGLSVEQVSKDLLVSRQHILSLESDSFERFPAKVFAIGYIRKYAKLVGLDGDELVSEYEKISSLQGNDESQDYFLAKYPDNGIKHKKEEFRKNEFKKNIATPKWIVSIGVFGLAAVVLLFVILSGSSNDAGQMNGSGKIKTIVDEVLLDDVIPVDVIAAENPEASLPVVIEPTEKINGIKESQVETDLLANATEEQLELEKNDSKEVLAPVFAQAEKIDRLSFSFTEECWLNVTEAEGNVIYSGIVAADTSLELQGRGPFQLMIGNAAATRLSLNGEVISIEPQSGRKTAKISVGG